MMNNMMTPVNVLLIHNDRQFCFKRYCDVHLPIKMAEFKDKGLRVIASGRMEIEVGQSWMERQKIAHQEIGMIHDEKGSLLAG